MTPLPDVLTDREYQKFGLNTQGLVSVRTLAELSAPGVTSPSNSSTTPLGIGGIFTGSFDDVSSYAFLSFQIFSNVASAVNGLEFQWSPDGINADRIETTNVLAG